jgi:hypothetical protein
VIENLLHSAPDQTLASFYQTPAGAEIDLVLEFPGGNDLWAIEIKRSQTGRVERGFHIACDDLKPTRRFLVGAGDQSFPLSQDLQFIGLRALAAMLAAV